MDHGIWVYPVPGEVGWGSRSRELSLSWARLRCIDDGEAQYATTRYAALLEAGETDAAAAMLAKARSERGKKPGRKGKSKGVGGWNNWGLSSSMGRNHVIPPEESRVTRKG